MLKISVKPDCENAPKKQFLKDFNIAFAKSSLDFILANVSEDIDWNIIGDKHIQGKSDFEASLKEMQSVSVKELTIHNILTHGREGAVHGMIIMQDAKQYAFCDIYSFKNTKDKTIKSMTSYVIELIKN